MLDFAISGIYLRVWISIREDNLQNYSHRLWLPGPQSTELGNNSPCSMKCNVPDVAPHSIRSTTWHSVNPSAFPFVLSVDPNIGIAVRDASCISAAASAPAVGARRVARGRKLRRVNCRKFTTVNHAKASNDQSVNERQRQSFQFRESSSSLRFYG